MIYAFIQRVVEATPEQVFRAVRRSAREQGFVEGPSSRTRGFLGERVAPITGGSLTGRLWVWPLTGELSVTYLAIEARGPVAAVPGARRRLRRLAEDLLAGADLPTFELRDMPIAA